MIKAGIVGGTGYSGKELLRLLSFHSGVEVLYVSSRDKDKPVIDDYPFLPKKYSNLRYKDVDKKYMENLDVIFLATPSDTSHKIVKDIYDGNKVIIDISADFRLENNDYKRWYKFDHFIPELLDKAVYCIPEINRTDIKKDVKIIANPGCYPTSVLIPLIPVLEKVDPETIIIDSKSGVSGAGKKVAEDYLFCEVNESLKAYSIGRKHRHIPEIERYIKLWTGKNKKIVFTPHLIPINRGIISTIYLTGISETDYKIACEYVYEKYRDELFIKIVEPQIKNVIYTNHCHFNLYYDGISTMIIVSVIDNLIKGASGQAIQNMNILFGFDEKEGLC
ncbi:MAG TPA: N-acetyl-gamma-glutamyl-phosphate reductase [Spirochaetota bacterium]|nr:N-acetyl-gamma-glutamyl-phosphate reductase [Spirochaetota bacterium]HOM38746.1 N-acetyl-gamma-glutamyl-phosphate reductase [Spirochaetota bacterium]HPQ49544.1 N-acetyl-gamma-glutamyl-phosphate reductase [Spirochaetota bacterium]